MLYEEMRIVYDDGSALTDYSVLNQDESENVTLALSTTKFLYIGQKCPFTSMYFYIHTGNSVDTGVTLKVEYWDGTTWREVADMLNDTISANKPLHKSGTIKWYLDDDYNWQKVLDTTDDSAPAELADIRIYDLYWVRISSTAPLSSNTTAHQIAYTFTSTQELNNYDVEISGYYASFETGKGNWIREIITASKLTLMEMKRRGLVTHSGQILELDDFNIPCSYKALELIYSNLGPSYVEKRKWASEEFAKSLNVQRPVIDTDKDGKITGSETKGTPRMMVR